MDDAGQYQCLAESELGTAEKVVILVLQSECPEWGPMGQAGPGGSLQGTSHRAEGKEVEAHYLEFSYEYFCRAPS